MLTMVGVDRSDELHRHHVEVLARIRAQLRRTKAAPEQSYNLYIRSKEATDRAEAARKRAQAALERARASTAVLRLSGQERELAAAERERVADERDRIADERDRTADERDRVADERESTADERDSPPLAAKPPAPTIHDDGQSQGHAAVRQLAFNSEETAKAFSRVADMAEQMAQAADAYATLLENSAQRGGDGKRRAMAAREREVADIARRNAERLRRPVGQQRPLGLEHLTTPLLEEPPEQSADSSEPCAQED